MKTIFTKTIYASIVVLIFLMTSCKHNDNSKKDPSINIEDTTNQPVSAYGNLNPDLPPSGNFDLSNWYLSVPTDTDNNGKAGNTNILKLVFIMVIIVVVIMIMRKLPSIS